MTPDLSAYRARFPDVVDPRRELGRHWREALRDVPRDAFVPAFLLPRPDRPGWDVVEPPDPRWADLVFRNRPLVTQLDGTDTAVEAIRRGETVQGFPTSSSSQPRLMMIMLRALGLRDGDRVLEIGTGSGYNAALLSHRLGADRVTTVDVDPGVTDRARTRLARLGHHPHVVTGDGMAGHRAGGPYDHVIATVAVPGVPQAWIDQTRDGGRILFPLDTRTGGGIMPLLTVTGDTAEGHLLPAFGGFMPLRQARRHDHAVAAFRARPDVGAGTRATSLPHRVVTDPDDPGEFYLALATGGLDHTTVTPDDGAVRTWIAATDGSWACHTDDDDGGHRVSQGGPRRIWDRVEELHRQWTDLGCPQRSRFGLTAGPGTRALWLDEPSRRLGSP